MGTTDERRELNRDRGRFRFHDGPIPADFEGTPLTAHEMETWAGLTDGERAMFRGYLSSEFRWVLDREGDGFRVWLDAAKALRLAPPNSW